MLHVALCMLHVACCTSHVACCMAKQRDDTTAAAITAPHRTAIAHGIRVCDENQGRAGRSGQGVALRSTRLARATRSSTTRSSTRSAKTCALPGAALPTRCSRATYALQPRCLRAAAACVRVVAGLGWRHVCQTDCADCAHGVACLFVCLLVCLLVCSPFARRLFVCCVQVQQVFEIGTYRGGSLKMWQGARSAGANNAHFRCRLASPNATVRACARALVGV